MKYLAFWFILQTNELMNERHNEQNNRELRPDTKCLKINSNSTNDSKILTLH